MSFQFRFESIHRLRCRQRDEAGVEVGNANEAIRRVEEQASNIQKQRDEIRVQSSDILGGNSQSPLPIDRILQRGRFDMQLQAEQVNLQQTIATLKKERDRRQELLIEAEAEVKRLERLRETQAAAHHHSQMLRDQAEADDMTTARMVIARLQAAKQRTHGPIS